MAKYAQTTTGNPEGAEGLIKYPRDKVPVVFREEDEIMHPNTPNTERAHRGELVNKQISQDKGVALSSINCYYKNCR